MGETSEILGKDGSGNTEFLVSKAKAGSDAAWREIYRRYRVMLVAHVQATFAGYRGGRFHAEDALQQAFLNAWEGIQGFEYRNEGAFRRWLVTLVLNAFRHEITRRATREAQADSGQLARVEDETATGDPVRRQENEALLEALGRLDEVDRDVLIQYIIEERSFEAIAEAQGTSRETLRQVYLRAHERLTRLLADR